MLERGRHILVTTTWVPAGPFCGGSPQVLDVPLLCSPGHRYPRDVCATPTTWDAMSVSSCFLFSQFAMMGIFVWIGYPDPLYEAWHLLVLPSALSPQYAWWNFVHCANSKPFTSMGA